MTAIFISYRREDSEGYVGRLYDQLLHYFDEREIFLDIKTIRPGEDFTKAIERMGGTCDALIAVIGAKWLEIQDEKGNRRLHNLNDYVRYEIASALARNILVIPVLVARARMPSESELPYDLRELSKRNAIELSHDRFSFDVERIAHAIGGSYGKIVIRVSFKDSGLLGIYENQEIIEKIDLKKYRQPFAIQMENGVHHLHARLNSFHNFSGQEILYQNIFRDRRNINEFHYLIKSDVLQINLRVGQTQNITIEREMIFPAQYEIRRERSVINQDHTIETKQLTSPPKYKLLIKPY
jgi:hypothetical protein